MYCQKERRSKNLDQAHISCQIMKLPIVQYVTVYSTGYAWHFPPYPPQPLCISQHALAKWRIHLVNGAIKKMSHISFKCTWALPRMHDLTIYCNAAFHDNFPHLLLSTRASAICIANEENVQPCILKVITLRSTILSIVQSWPPNIRSEYLTRDFD